MSHLPSAPANATRVAPPLESGRAYPAKPSDVYLFGTCVVDVFFPGAGMDAICLLEREGIKVHFPQAQSCCGQPAYTSGYTDEAREVARAQLALFAGEWPVVVPSGSCAGMFRHHYFELFSLTLTPPSNTSRRKARSTRRPARHRKRPCIYAGVGLSRAGGWPAAA